MTSPTKMALVPAEATAWGVLSVMGDVLLDQRAWPGRDEAENAAAFTKTPTYVAPLYTSPSSGRLPAADLERAAEAHYRAGTAHLASWRDMMPVFRNQELARMRAAFAAIGLPVEGEDAQHG